MDLEVSIIDDREVVHYPKPDKPIVMRAVTYQLGQGVPRVVYVPAAEYSEGRLQAEIRADLERSRTVGARTLRL